MKPIQDPDINAIQTLIENQSSPRSDFDSVPFIVLRTDQHVESIERLLPAPLRKKGSPSFRQAESFCRYVNEHKTASSRIYANPTSFICVLDHHGEGPQWGEHRATYCMVISPMWQTWVTANKQRKTQREFGLLIEDNLEDISEPKSAELLDMVRQFEAISTVEFKSAERGDNGNFSLSYVQTVQSRAGQKGEVELPKGFTLLIPAYEGAGLRPIHAKLRFDISGGKLSLWYELHQPERFLEEHAKAVAAEISEETEIEPFHGTP